MIQTTAPPLQAARGMPLGVDEDLPDCSHIWPNKTELSLQEENEETPTDPIQHANYPSAKEHENAIELTYEEDKAEGMALGPLDDMQAATLCVCTPAQLCHGALAGKPEGRYGDKLGTIHDATVNHVNEWIQLHQHQRTTAPTLQDLMTCLHTLSRPDIVMLKFDARKRKIGTR